MNQREAAREAVRHLEGADRRATLAADLKAARLEREAAPGERRLNGTADGTATTWASVNLEALVDGGELGEPPALLARADDVRLLYRGKLHALSGEPEAGKGWLALYAVAERLRAGERALYIDFEDTPATIVGRLLALGVDGNLIVAGLDYRRPDEPLDDHGRAELDAALARHPTPTLAIVDGVTEALAVHGLDLRDNGDVARWLSILPRTLAVAGAAVVLLDHVVKDKENRGRFAIGAQHKLAGVDVAYTVEVVEPFGRGREGLAKLVVTKDRPGFIRQHSEHGRIADVVLRSTHDGEVEVELRPPERAGAAFRPTVLMERLSLAAEANPGLSKRGLRETVGGKNDAKDLALEVLAAEGYLRTERDGTAVRHHSERPYRQDEDDRAPVPRPCPDRAPARSEGDRAPVPLPTGEHGTGHGRTGTPKKPDRAPTRNPTT